MRLGRFLPSLVRLVFVSATLANLGSTQITVTSEAQTSDQLPATPSQMLQADFSATPLTGGVPLVVRFQNLSTGAVESGQWDYGDGTTAPLDTKSHTYLTPGVYSVGLTVNGPGGSSDGLLKMNLVVATIQDLAVDFAGGPTVGLAPLTVVFQSLGRGGATSVSWDFGDSGSGSSSTTPVHMYANPGVYTVTHTAMDATDTVVETKVGYITVLSPPTPVAMAMVNTPVGLTNMFTSGGNEHSGGAAWVDINNDFFDDLVITNGFGVDNILYLNDGDGTFTEMSSLIPKPDLLLEVAGVKQADFDNDGDMDLLMPVDFPVQVFGNVGGPNLLYVNQGNLTFVEDAANSGIVDPLGWRNISSGVADYDRDGFVDVYLDRWDQAGQTSVDFGVMYRNDGDGTFTVDTNAGPDGRGRDALTSIWFDANNDGWPDLYTANTGEETEGTYEPENDDVFYINNGDNTFRDATCDVFGFGNDAKSPMGMDVGDIDNDGDWDLYITDNPQDGPAPHINVLYLGNGDGTFQDNTCDVANVCGVPSWSCNFADFNLDGWTDLWVGALSQQHPDLMFLNNGDGTFTEQALSTFNGNENRGGTISDYDGDGDVDIVMVNRNQNSQLYRNDSSVAGSWMEFKLIGQTSNAAAIGAVVRVSANGMTQMRRVSGGDSSHSHQSLIVHFGVGNATTADVQIDWPSGASQSFMAVGVDELVFIDEDDGILPQTVKTRAWYDADAKSLTVSARSNYGGRTDLLVQGFGPMQYDARSVRFTSVIEEVEAAPESVVVTSSRGGSWTVPVEAKPVSR